MFLTRSENTIVFDKHFKCLTGLIDAPDQAVGLQSILISSMRWAKESGDLYCESTARKAVRPSTTAAAVILRISNILA
jgi:hypothetical protein